MDELDDDASCGTWLEDVPRLGRVGRSVQLGAVIGGMVVGGLFLFCAAKILVWICALDKF